MPWQQSPSRRRRTRGNLDARGHRHQVRGERDGVVRGELALEEVLDHRDRLKGRVGEVQRGVARQRAEQEQDRGGPVDSLTATLQGLPLTTGSSRSRRCRATRRLPRAARARLDPGAGQPACPWRTTSRAAPRDATRSRHAGVVVGVDAGEHRVIAKVADLRGEVISQRVQAFSTGRGPTTDPAWRTAWRGGRRGRSPLPRSLHRRGSARA